MALISKDNERNASVCEVSYPNERTLASPRCGSATSLKENSYDKLFISCSSIQQALGDIPAAVKGIWKELKIDKSTKINIE